ncbi:DUF6912 family protein [Enemella dayhoffiae]|nr:hypothetical protein [Enemella dayhoffiae]
MGDMVFWATTPDQLRQLAAAGSQSVIEHVFGATSVLREEFGYGPDETEEADFAAQLFASLDCLRTGADRLVLAVEVSTPLRAAAAEAAYGRLTQTELPWRTARAIFRDAPESLPALRVYAESLHGKQLPELWEDESVREALSEHDLLWFDPSELEQALDGLHSQSRKEN